MKVLQINCVYKSGSTGKLVYDIHQGLLQTGIESLVAYGRGLNQEKQFVYKISGEIEAKLHSAFSRLFGVEFAYSPVATEKIIRLIEKEKPDIVHLHCLNGHFVNVYKLLAFLKEKEIKTVLTLHAEIMHTAGCEHALDCNKWKSQCSSCEHIQGKVSHFFRDDAKYCFLKMQDAFKDFDRNLWVVGVSDWLTERAKQSAIFTKQPHFLTIENGVNTDIFHYLNRDECRKKHNIPVDKKIVLHVTPSFSHPIKGGKYVLELAELMPDVQFVIVGYDVADTHGLPQNVLTLHRTENQVELAEYYAMADALVLTSQRETFSMVCAESLCCGTPVAGFLAGGPESITLPEYSSFVENSNVDALQKLVQQILVKKCEAEQIAMKACERYSVAHMQNAYINLYKRMLNQ